MGLLHGRKNKDLKGKLRKKFRRNNKKYDRKKRGIMERRKEIEEVVKFVPTNFVSIKFDKKSDNLI